MHRRPLETKWASPVCGSCGSCRWCWRAAQRSVAASCRRCLGGEAPVSAPPAAAVVAVAAAAGGGLCRLSLAPLAILVLSSAPARSPITRNKVLQLIQNVYVIYK